MVRIVVVCLMTLLGCGQSATTRKPVEIEPKELGGIRFAAPKGSTYSMEGEGDEVITGARYHVEILKQRINMTLAGYKETVESEQSSQVVATTTDHGWALDYTVKDPTGNPETFYVRYAGFGEDDMYLCEFSEGESPDIATSNAICSSIAKK